MVPGKPTDLIPAGDSNRAFLTSLDFTHDSRLTAPEMIRDIDGAKDPGASGADFRFFFRESGNWHIRDGQP
jgi:hypothetical protein